MRKNHILLVIIIKSFNPKIYSRNILFRKDATYIVNASYEQFYKLFSSTCTEFILSVFIRVAKRSPVIFPAAQLGKSLDSFSLHGQIPTE